MADDSQSSRIAKLETISAYHGAMLERITSAMEKNAEFNGQIAAHIESSNRLWITVESHGKQLAELQTANAADRAFFAQIRKTFWWAVSFLTLGLGYLIKFFIDNHGQH